MPNFFTKPDNVNYCDGPEIYGLTQNDRYITPWAIWVSDTGIRIGQFSEIVPPANDQGMALNYFGDMRPEQLSFCFDQDAKPVVAIQRQQNVIELRKEVAGIVTPFRWFGLWPQMFYNGLLVYETGDTDTVCFYLKEDQNKIYARFQRDNFGVEYEINPTIVPSVNKLTGTERDRSWQKLYGTSSFNSQLDFTSKPYDPFPAIGEDEATNTVLFAEGEYYATVIFLDAGQERGVNSVLFEEGEYFDTIIDLDLSGISGPEQGTTSIQFEDGVYYDTIIESSLGPEEASNIILFDSGLYFQSIVDGGSHDDASVTSVSFDSGTYA